MLESKPGNNKDSRNMDNIELKNKYAQFIIKSVWERLANSGINNADSLIGTRETIDNIDSAKFWENVKKEDIQKLIDNYTTQKQEAIKEFEKFKGEFNPQTGTITSGDTSFFDEKISELTTLKDLINN